MPQKRRQIDRRAALQTLGLLAGAPLLTGVPYETLVQVARAARATPPSSRGVLEHPEAAVVTELAEIIIPATDTPGATDADVTGFIDTLLDGWMNADERDAFREGIAAVDARCVDSFAAGFLDVTVQDRTALVQEMDHEVAELLEADRAGKGDAVRAPKHFFYQMKRLTMLGYFTSEVGMVETLHYVAYPGRWDPCVELEQSR